MDGVMVIAWSLLLKCIPLSTGIYGQRLLWGQILRAHAMQDKLAKSGGLKMLLTSLQSILLIEQTLYTPFTYTLSSLD